MRIPSSKIIYRWLLSLVAASYTSFGAFAQSASYALGGTYPPNAAVQSLPYDDLAPGWQFHHVDYEGFFSILEFLTDENQVIRVISYEKRYITGVEDIEQWRLKVQQDFFRLKYSLEQRYGTFDVSNAKNLLGSESNRNYFWVQEIDEFITIDNAAPGIAKVRIALSAPEISLTKSNHEREISLSLIYFSEGLAEQLLAD